MSKDSDKTVARKLNLKTDSLPKEKIFKMLALNSRDKDAVKMFYKFYDKEHTLKFWLDKLSKDGFNVLNIQELQQLIK